ncbi:1324_t:CDS:2 [Diversispora eburnea]|uniref:1324_t:CDS:1 n=1 Tax=Diversispora eburnea TaxID=1213867 RepID=A0A9N9CH01_9GLOM|nr:1324_t:CDS:2 [Diversispora eburnea]
MGNNSAPTGQESPMLRTLINALPSGYVQFLTWLKQLDGKDYKAESIHNCYESIAIYLKEIQDSVKLQNEGLGVIKQASPLSTEEIIHILDHKIMQHDTNESLTRRVFFFVYICGLRDGDAERINFNNISRHNDGGLYLTFNHEKNNQRGALKRNKDEKSSAQKYLFLRINACASFFLETTRAEKGLNKLNTMMAKIANITGINLDNGRKRLKDLNVPEDECMEFSGYRSREGIRVYNNPSEDQKLCNTLMLIPLDFDDIPYEEFDYFPVHEQQLYVLEHEQQLYVQEHEQEHEQGYKEGCEQGCEESCDEGSKLFEPFKPPVPKSTSSDKSSHILKPPNIQHSPLNPQPLHKRSTPLSDI